jgi:hypothetical protein
MLLLGLIEAPANSERLRLNTASDWPWQARRICLRDAPHLVKYPRAKGARPFGTPAAKAARNPQQDGAPRLR